MIRTIGAQIALVAFAATVLAGLYTGNSSATVLTRALLAMVAALVVGQGVAWAVKLVLRDHLRQRKLAIDREHFAALEDSEQEEPGASQNPAPAETR
jgi:dsRNA-specific ribonuclease